VARRVAARTFNNKGHLSRMDCKYFQLALFSCLDDHGGKGRSGGVVVIGAEISCRQKICCARELYCSISWTPSAEDWWQRRAPSCLASSSPMVTCFDLASMVVLPPSYMPMWRIFSSYCWTTCNGPGPSGVSPVSGYLAQRRFVAVEQ
jgi:hypothetical protein